MPLGGVATIKQSAFHHAGYRCPDSHPAAEEKRKIDSHLFSSWNSACTRKKKSLFFCFFLSSNIVYSTLLPLPYLFIPTLIVLFLILFTSVLFTSLPLPAHPQLPLFGMENAPKLSFTFFLFGHSSSKRVSHPPAQNVNRPTQPNPTKIGPEKPQVVVGVGGHGGIHMYILAKLIPPKSDRIHPRYLMIHLPLKSPVVSLPPLKKPSAGPEISIETFKNRP